MVAAAAGESHSAGDKVIYRWIKAFVLSGNVKWGSDWEGLMEVSKGLAVIVIFPALLLS